jgi:hypothetical protein
MILDLLVEENQKTSTDFAKHFSKINLIELNPKLPLQAQVSRIEDELGEPSNQKMLVYSKRYSALGIVLSRRYVNAARLDEGPLKIANTTLLPNHISNFPNKKRRNRVLFLAPHCDEAYLAAILPHKMIGDEVFLHAFTHPKEQKERIERAYGLLDLSKDDYSLGTLKVNNLFRAKKTIRTTLESLLIQFDPTVVFSVFPKGANFDHIALSQVAKSVIINKSKADLIYGYVIQSRNTNPTIFPILSERINRKILRAFGQQGFGDIFKDYLPFLRHYMQTLSEPLFRMARTGKIWSLPFEAERIANYRIPNLI